LLPFHDPLDIVFFLEGEGDPVALFRIMLILYRTESPNKFKEEEEEEAELVPPLLLPGGGGLVVIA
jgi:hypothetical protein